jgi:hypothetical protein
MSKCSCISHVSMIFYGECKDDRHRFITPSFIDDTNVKEYSISRETKLLYI